MKIARIYPSNYDDNLQFKRKTTFIFNCAMATAGS